MKKGVELREGPKIPPDLDAAAKKKWAELIGAVDFDADLELLGNYCRQHSTLMAIRKEKAALMKAGTFSTMVPGRDKALQLNPLLTAENRMVASLNRQLRGLGLAPTREEQDSRKKKPLPGPAPPGMTGAEPTYGWEIAIALCRFRMPGAIVTPEEMEQERQWDDWIAKRRNSGGKYGHR